MIPKTAVHPHFAFSQILPVGTSYRLARPSTRRRLDDSSVLHLLYFSLSLFSFVEGDDVIVGTKQLLTPEGVTAFSNHYHK